MKVHTGEKPFKCSYCDRWFGHKCDVVKHERVHTGEKPYSCQHCGRAFSQKGALRVHIRTHTKERPYVCPHKNCEKAFPILSSLQRHLCKHSGTKPFACDLCPVSFFTQTHLKRHRKTHFEEQPGVSIVHGINLYPGGVI
jgi:KRAB domain-containing zinc finger protein